MTEPKATVRRVEVNVPILGPRSSKTKTLRARRLSDYPSISAAHKDVASKLSSTLLMGPPICDEYMAFVEHLFTPEEAEVARHLGGMRGRSAQAVARAARRPLDEVERILHCLAFEKCIIAAAGPEGRKRYKLMPVMPGIFEMGLFSQRPETMTDWHRRFAELFEALYETGYLLDYAPGASPMVRFLPIGRTFEGHPMALPSDRLEVVLDRYNVFGVGQCQCRMTMQVLGKGCGKPLSNCMVMGEFAAAMVKQGRAREVSRQDALDIKREAEAHGCATWIMNVEATKGQVSCSCCGCCCHAMRAISEFNAPGLIAPPHFIPEFDLAKCTFCGMCAKNCPMGAITVVPAQKTHHHERVRCIGCGLCVLACDRAKAVTMEPVPDWRMPYRSWFSLLLRSTPNRLRTAWRVRRARR